MSRLRLTTDPASNSDSLKRYLREIDEIPPLVADLRFATPGTIQTALETFESERSKLLKTHRRQWVAYTVFGDRRIAKTQTELYDYFLNAKRLNHEQFIVRRIEPETSRVAEYSSVN